MKLPIYPFEKALELKGRFDMGDELDAESIDGATAMRVANYKFHKVKINDKLIPSCQYIFWWNRKHTHLCAARVSMHPKTAANIERGSRRFGSMSISRELEYDF